MKLFVNGTDIFNSVSLQYCMTEDFDSGRSSLLILRFGDPKGLWSGWNIGTGTEISFENGDYKSGRMYIHVLRAENGIYTVRAFSVPTGANIRKNKSWQAVHFYQLVYEFAANLELEPRIYGAADHLYKYLRQFNMSDLSFLHELCRLEGYGIIVYDGKLIIYDGLTRDKTPASKIVEIGPDGVYTFADRSANAYNGAAVYAGSCSGSFMLPGKVHDRILTPESVISCTTDAEAARFAHGMLRQANKWLVTGSFRKELQLDLSAGSVIRLKNKKAAFDDRVILTRVRHDHIKNASTITFRRTLEDY